MLVLGGDISPAWRIHRNPWNSCWRCNSTLDAATTNNVDVIWLEIMLVDCSFACPPSSLFPFYQVSGFYISWSLDKKSFPHFIKNHSKNPYITGVFSLIGIFIFSTPNWGQTFPLKKKNKRQGGRPFKKLGAHLGTTCFFRPEKHPRILPGSWATHLRNTFGTKLRIISRRFKGKKQLCNHHLVPVKHIGDNWQSQCFVFTSSTLL